MKTAASVTYSLRLVVLLCCFSVPALVQSAPITVKIGDTLGVKFRFDAPFSQTPNALFPLFVPYAGKNNYYGGYQATLYDGATILGLGNGSSGGALAEYFVAPDNPFAYAFPTFPKVDFTTIRNQSINGLIKMTLTSGAPLVYDPKYDGLGLGFGSTSVGASKFNSDGSGVGVGAASILSVTLNGRSIFSPPTYTPKIAPPTAAPPISSFPQPSQLYNTIGTFTRNNSSQFSTSTQTFNASQLSTLSNAADGFKSGAQSLVQSYDSLKQQGAITTSKIIAGLAANPTSAVDSLLLPLYLDDAGIQGNTRLAIDAATYLLAVGGAVVGASAYAVPAAVVSSVFYITNYVAIPTLRIIGEDPPTLDFTNVATATIPSFEIPASTGDPQVDVYLLSFLTTNSLVTGYLEALNASFDRYTAAYYAGDTISAGLQISAMLHYMALLENPLKELGAMWAELPSVLATLNFDPDVDMTSFLESAQEALLASGISDSLHDFLLSEGLSEAEIASGNESFLRLSWEGSSGDDLSAYSTLGNRLANFADPTDGSSKIPEPGILALVAIALSMLGLARRLRR